MEPETPADQTEADLIYSLVGDEMPAYEDLEDECLAIAARPLIPFVKATPRGTKNDEKSAEKD